jgi:hypothetical protein
MAMRYDLLVLWFVLSGLACAAFAAYVRLTRPAKQTELDAHYDDLERAKTRPEARFE